MVCIIILVRALRSLCLFYISMTALMIFIFFFFNDPAPTDIYPLPLHDALPIFAANGPLGGAGRPHHCRPGPQCVGGGADDRRWDAGRLSLPRRPRGRTRRPLAGAGLRVRLLVRSEEHTSELQSQSNLVCRLLLE